MKKAVLFLTVLLSLCITGCSEDRTAIVMHKSAKLEAPFERVYADEKVHILVDVDTLVMYVMTNNGYGGTAMTVMVDQEGNPRLYDGTLGFAK